MPMVRANEQAFASPFGCGMTLREYIATQALAALTGKYGADQAANLAVVYADALLTRLAQPEGTQQPFDPDEELIDLAAAGEIDDDDGQPD